MRKGFLFSTDALLAALILVGGTVLIASIVQHTSNTTQLSSASEDMLASLSAVSMVESTNPWITQGLSNGTFDMNSTYLEQIGLLWATGRTAEAQRLAQTYLDNQYTGYGVRLTIDGNEVYVRNTTKDGKNKLVSSRMISGIASGKAVTGSSAVAYLRHIKDKRNTAIINFGGFIGEGNITLNTSDIPSGANVTDMVIEVDTEQTFDLLINGNRCDRLVPTPAPLIPSSWDRTNCTQFIVPGTPNIISLNFTGTLNGSAVSGGNIKLTYTTNVLSESNTTDTIYQFPGINGLINLYDGFYVEGSLSSMNITLHFLSNYTTYLTIGNASVTFAGSNASQIIFINDTQIQSALTTAGLTYSNLSQRTIPLRFGIGNVIINGAAADIVVVTDTSGSMAWCSTDDSTTPCPANDSTKILFAKNVTLDFLNTTLNGTSGTRVGLSEFSDSIKSWSNLTTNLTFLRNQVNTYAATGGTCICCGVNNATAILTGEGQSILIQRGSSGWKYNDSNLASPPANWNTSSFNDTKWSNGTTNLGWGYAGQSTTITNRYQGDYYERKYFNVTNVSSILFAELYVDSDDGADVYINGKRVDNNYGSTISSGIYWNENDLWVNGSVFVNGQNIIAVRQYHKSSPNKMAFDLELIANTKGNITGNQRKNIVFMTDGQANDQCVEQNTGDASTDAIKAACDAYANYGIIVYTVGFGVGADNATLQAMANCTTGTYFHSGNGTALKSAFAQIASTIIASSTTQTAITAGNVSNTILYGDSVIKANYTPSVQPPSQNEISVTIQSPPLSSCISNVTLQPGMRFLDAYLTSYSSDYWTDFVSVGGSTIYNLSQYSKTYASLGDPYKIRIPPSLLATGNNTVSMRLGIDALNSSANCSSNNTLVYTAAINLSTERSTVVDGAVGCKWQVSFVDNTTKNLTIPTTYSGTNGCSYRPGNISYNATDAYQLGAYTLFERLDFTKQGAIFVDLDAADLEVIVTTIGGVPYMWGPAAVKLEVTQ